MIKTIVFDMDGTLLNTLDDLMDSVNKTMVKFGFPIRTYEEIRSFVGNGIGLLIKRSMPEGKDEYFDECLKYFQEDYLIHMNDKTAPYEGIMEMLKAVKEEGYNTSVVSNKFDAGVKSLCEDCFKGFIDLPVGESETVRKKPAPDGVLKVLEHFKTPLNEAVYIGDSDVDMETAKNAGVKSIGVTWGFRDRELLEKYGVDVIIDHPSQILEAIKSFK